MSGEESPSADARGGEGKPTADGSGGASGCPFHQSGESHEAASNPGVEETRKPGFVERAVDRRSFLRTALAIGGAGALAAVTGSASGTSALGSLDVPRGTTDPGDFPERQHAWGRDLKTDPFGNGVLPNHQLILFLNYTGDGPTDAEREEVEAAFHTLEAAFQRLSGGDPDGDNEGLVFMVGYSRSYFDRLDSVSGSGALARPETVLRATGDDPEKADHYDAVVLLSSATVPVLLASELALFGEIETVNGVDVGGTLEGIFEKAERRTAFVGRGLPRENLVDDPDAPLADESPGAIDDADVEANLRGDAPLSMGYKSGFKDNLATEDAVTITEGPFEGGTMFQVSRLRLDLGEWYENDRATRDELMFSHEHSEAEIGRIGEGLGTDSGITEAVVDDLHETARERGRVGHAAKTARARDEDFEPLILRRSEGVNNSFVGDGEVAFNFSAVMEDIEDFIRTRQAMNSTDLDEHVDEGGHGILPYMEVTNRATFVLPPRSRRSLPAALPDP